VGIYGKNAYLKGMGYILTGSLGKKKGKDVFFADTKAKVFLVVQLFRFGKGGSVFYHVRQFKTVRPWRFKEPALQEGKKHKTYTAKDNDYSKSQYLGLPLKLFVNLGKDSRNDTILNKKNKAVDSEHFKRLAKFDCPAADEVNDDVPYPVPKTVSKGAGKIYRIGSGNKRSQSQKREDKEQKPAVKGAAVYKEVDNYDKDDRHKRAYAVSKTVNMIIRPFYVVNHAHYKVIDGIKDDNKHNGGTEIVVCVFCPAVFGMFFFSKTAKNNYKI
jgi:hypothetical protein